MSFIDSPHAQKAQAMIDRYLSTHVVGDYVPIKLDEFQCLICHIIGTVVGDIQETSMKRIEIVDWWYGDDRKGVSFAWSRTKVWDSMENEHLVKFMTLCYDHKVRLILKPAGPCIRLIFYPAPDHKTLEEAVAEVRGAV